jgi:RNA-directed DNA polymerase
LEQTGYASRRLSASTSSATRFVPEQPSAAAARCSSAFCPAISNDAAKAIRHTIRRWRLHLRRGATLGELARSINTIARGWINYHGRFYRTELLRTLARVSEYLMRWAMRKCKRLRRRPGKAWDLVAAARQRQPDLFA